MTFILAWKDKKNVFVTGDAAVTNIGVPSKSIETIKSNGKLITSFGEPVYFSEDKVVQESVLKVHNIREEFIIGYAGVGNVAVDVINDLEADLEFSKNNIVSKIKEAAMIYGSSFQMVIGYYNKKSSVLLSFNLYGNCKVRFHSNNTPIRLGNLRSYSLIKLVSFEISNLFNLIKTNNTPDKKLVMASTFMQGVIIRAGLISKGVGGFFTGGYINRFGFYWQKDTGILKFELRKNAKKDSRNPSELFSNSQLVVLIIREAKLAVLSFSLHQSYRNVTVFQNFINSFHLKANFNCITKEFSEWKSKYESEIVDILTNLLFDFFVFLCTDLEAPNKMTFIEKKSLIEEKYFKIRWKQNHPVLTISGEVVDEFNPLKAEYLNQFHWLPNN